MEILNQDTSETAEIRNEDPQIYLRDILWGRMDWIHLAQDRDQWRALVKTVMNLRVPQNVKKLLSSCATGKNV
jgi:hypothetical protein